MMSKKNILFINGVADTNKVKVTKVEKNGNIKWRTRGSANISNYLENDLFHCMNIVFDTRMDQMLPRQMVHGVFNQISDPDTNKISLEKVQNFYKAISTQVPFFNIPSHVMRTTRDNIYQMLQGIDKLHVPKTVKIQPKSPKDIYNVIKEEGFQFPVILRQAGDHGGISTIRVDNETEQFYAFPLDGRDYYLTQFVEYAEDGLYIKYRLIVVDSKVYLRHVKVSAGWMVHHKSQIDDPEEVQKISAKRFFDHKEAVQEVVTKIYDRLQLDYFGIDCSIDKDMNLLIFEINPSMGVFLQAKGDIFSKNVDEIRQAVIKMIDNRRCK
ncbi:MAG: ATP-grasp domain-containing protein [Sulfurovaceae bacterium]